jgi:hypothetical protein
MNHVDENQAEIGDRKIDDIQQFYVVFGANRVSTTKSGRVNSSAKH